MWIFELCIENVIREEFKMNKPIFNLRRVTGEDMKQMFMLVCVFFAIHVGLFIEDSVDFSCNHDFVEIMECPHITICLGT